MHAPSVLRILLYTKSDQVAVLQREATTFLKHREGPAAKMPTTNHFPLKCTVSLSLLQKPSVLQEFTLTGYHDMPSNRHNSSAKSHVIGIDEGARIPPSVNSCQIDLSLFSHQYHRSTVLACLGNQESQTPRHLFLDATGTSLCD